MVKLERDRMDELNFVLKKAEEAHEHLCPFLALGVRTVLIGVRELGAKKDDDELSVTVMLQDSASYPCFIDGIQVATRCKIGNEKLSLRVLNNPSGIGAKFELPNKDPVTVAVNPASLGVLIDTMKKGWGNVTPEEFQQLVQFVVSMPEEELFIVRRR